MERERAEAGTTGRKEPDVAPRMKSRCEVSTRVLLYETRLSASAGSRNTVGELPIHST